MAHESDYTSEPAAKSRTSAEPESARARHAHGFAQLTMRRLLQSEFMRDLVSFNASLIFHCVLLLVLAIMMVKPPLGADAPTILLGAPSDPDDTTEWVEILTAADLESELANPAKLLSEEVLTPDPINVLSPVQAPHVGGITSRPSTQANDLVATDLLMISEAPVGGGFEGRAADERARLALERGGTRVSEDAVERGLAWLAAHQRQDGSWWLDHGKGPCDGRCSDPGKTVETAIGATGLAVLPFLGAGYTHLQGKYRTVVQRALEFLQSQLRVTNHGGDLSWDSTVGMYAHGIATLALCEAYAMTGDESLEPFAQPAIDFISRSQGPRGGWRYVRGEPGDTTVTGWQIMALKSARIGRLFVSRETTEKTKGFLNSVQDGGGAFYGYLTPVKEPGPTSVGLLLRMYLGWTRQDDRLRRGVNYLAHLGPSKSDMYFNYYATQVLHHYGGRNWPSWNETMREFLIKSQARTGHESGSWFFADPHGSVGGRHYTTAVCTMILEVYYRYMPLYGELTAEDSL